MLLFLYYGVFISINWTSARFTYFTNRDIFHHLHYNSNDCIFIFFTSGQLKDLEIHVEIKHAEDSRL